MSGPREAARERSKAIGAVDIGGTKIAIAVIDPVGTVLAKEEVATRPARGFEAAMKEVCDCLTRASETAGVQLSGIGMGCTGPVDPFTGRIGDVEFLPGWDGCSPTEALSEMLGVGAAMENDADAAALADALWGAGKGKKTLMSLTVGTGIGAGLIVNGALYRGVEGAHPEIGHHVIDASGPACFCGANGCWEVLASGPALTRHYLQAAHGELATKQDHSAASICTAARAGDAAAMRAVEVTGRYLGIGLANVITSFMPELIVLSGSVMESADLLLPWIRRVIDSSCRLVPAKAVGLVHSSFGRDAPLIGAGAVWQFRNQGTSIS